MRNIFYYLMLWLIICSCNESAHSGLETKKNVENESVEARDAINRNNQQIVKWYREKRQDSLVTLMTDQVIQLPPNSEPLRGKENIGKYWGQLFQWGDVDFTLQAQDVKVNGTLAIELGKYSFLFEPNNKSPVPAIKDTGNYVVCWEKNNGLWKIVWDAPVSSVPLNQH